MKHLLNKLEALKQVLTNSQNIDLTHIPNNVFLESVQQLSSSTIEIIEDLELQTILAKLEVFLEHDQDVGFALNVLLNEDAAHPPEEFIPIRHDYKGMHSIDSLLLACGVSDDVYVKLKEQNKKELAAETNPSDHYFYRHTDGMYEDSNQLELPSIVDDLYKLFDGESETKLSMTYLKEYDRSLPPNWSETSFEKMCVAYLIRDLEIDLVHDMYQQTNDKLHDSLDINKRMQFAFNKKDQKIDQYYEFQRTLMVKLGHNYDSFVNQVQEAMLSSVSPDQEDVLQILKIAITDKTLPQLSKIEIHRAAIKYYS